MKKFFARLLSVALILAVVPSVGAEDVMQKNAATASGDVLDLELCIPYQNVYDSVTLIEGVGTFTLQVTGREAVPEGLRAWIAQYDTFGKMIGLQQLSCKNTENGVNFTAVLPSEGKLFLLSDTWQPVVKPLQFPLREKITFARFADILGRVIEEADPAALAEWNSIAATALKTHDVMERDDGILMLYEAACVLGLGGNPSAYWTSASFAYGGAGFQDGFRPCEEIFANSLNMSPLESNYKQLAGWDYLTASKLFSMGQSSSMTVEPYFRQRSSTVRYDVALSVEEAEMAAYRLSLAYRSVVEGSFDINDYESDWNDPLLADVAAVRDAILSSPTSLVKSDTFIQGETYTGTAYYVSNSGSDTNDGLSPETAWATMEKVSRSELLFGDVVFFERGGVWSVLEDKLQMQTGVTYSAYGEGAKPIWTGSPLGMADAEKWTACGETSDGGTIWRYAEKLLDVGVVLLDGHIVARKAYPVWDGTQYRTNDGEPFTLETGLFADLMFFSDIDLSGKLLPENGEPLTIWTEMKTGALYLRCDAGNPGELFSSIEAGASVDAITTADGGYNTVDNINHRMVPMDCNGHDHITYQNCESSWCGGNVQSYALVRDHIVTNVSGGGMLLFGSYAIGQNNYIHDCENKGIAVVINGSGHANLERVEVLAEGNVVERCGSSIFLWTGLLPPDAEIKYENILIRENYFINAASGWRMHNQQWIGNGNGSIESHGNSVTVMNIFSTGEILIENNLFYRSAGPMVEFSGEDFSHKSKVPTMRGNTYVQDESQVLFCMRDEVGSVPEQAVICSDKKQRLVDCVKNGIGDKSGNVIVLR